MVSTGSQAYGENDRNDVNVFGNSGGKDDRLVSLNRAPSDLGLAMKVKQLDLSLLRDDIAAELHAYWLAKCSDGRLPARSDIDPLEFPWALGRVCLLEVTRDPLVFRYRVDGSIIAGHRGKDMTGCTTDEIRPLSLANVLRNQYSMIVRTAAPGYFEVRCARNMIATTYTTLGLPLASDGRAVDMILACALGTEAMFAFS